MDGDPAAQPAPRDGDLLRDAAAGDVAALEAFYDTHASSVRRHVSLMIDPDHVEEAVAKVFVEILDRIAAAPAGGSVDGWVQQVTDEVARDSLGGTDGAARPANEVRGELRALAHKARGGLASLTPSELRVATMAGFTDSSADAIAGAVGAGSVEETLGMIERATGRLRTALKLELLTRRHGGCAEFVGLLDAGDLVRAADHLRGCPVCLREGSIAIRRAVHPGQPLEDAVARIVVEDGDTRKVLVVDGRMVIGRECADVPPAQRLLINRDTVSRHHLEIRVNTATGHASVLDTSTNGTLVNGIRIERATPVALRSGDRITVGGVNIDFLGPPSHVVPTPDVRATIRQSVRSPMAMVVGDIVGYSEIAHRTDTGALSRALDAVYDELRSALRLCGGTLGNIVGDAFFGVWDLGAAPDGCGRALEFVLIATDVVGRLRDQLPLLPEDAQHFQFGWGVTLGDATTSVVSGLVTTVVGDATNVAFRLSALAGRDSHPQVFVLREVADAAPTGYLYGPPELVHIKGRDDPIEVVALLGRSGRAPA
jgi:class 3 adenylate cyclase/DNA-directed RNA polymerase specialized sigma24 family protein